VKFEAIKEMSWPANTEIPWHVTLCNLVIYINVSEQCDMSIHVRRIKYVGTNFRNSMICCTEPGLAETLYLLYTHLTTCQM
jgi:hypothetical protein